MFNRNKDLFFIKVLNKLLGNGFNLTKEDEEIYSVCYSNDLSIVVIISEDYYINLNNLLTEHTKEPIRSVYILIRQNNEYKLITSNTESEKIFNKYERIHDISISETNKTILIAYSENNKKYIDILKFNVNIINPEDSVENLPFIEHEYTIQIEDSNCYIESTMFVNSEHFGFKIMCSKASSERFILYYKYNIKTDEYLLSRKSNLLPNEYLTDGCSILFY